MQASALHLSCFCLQALTSLLVITLGICDTAKAVIASISHPHQTSYALLKSIRLIKVSCSFDSSSQCMFCVSCKSITGIAQTMPRPLVGGLAFCQLMGSRFHPCCRQDDDGDPDRGSASHTLPSGAHPGSHGHPNTHTWHGCVTWCRGPRATTTWARSRARASTWLAPACQQHVCGSAAEESPHER